jgi:hypothetical protein
LRHFLASSSPSGRKRHKTILFNGLHHATPRRCQLASLASHPAGFRRRRILRSRSPEVIHPKDCDMEEHARNQTNRLFASAPLSRSAQKCPRSRDFLTSIKLSG